MKENPSKAALVKEFYAEELSTDIKSTKASDVAGRITKQIKEILLEENGETVSQLKANMGILRRSLGELKESVKEIKEEDFQSEAAQRYKEVKDYLTKGIFDLEAEVNAKIQGVRAEVLEGMDAKIASRANSENPFITEVECFMAIMRQYEAKEETVSDGLCALLNSLSFVYWKRIEASMEKEKKSSDKFQPYQRKAGRTL